MAKNVTFAYVLLMGTMYKPLLLGINIARMNIFVS